VTVQLIPFHPDHLARFELQPAQAWMRSLIDGADYVRNMTACGAYSVEHAGLILCMGAVVTIWPGRAHASSLVSAQAGPHYLGLHRLVARHLAGIGARRIEATVDGEFPAGHRWLKLLGFSCETPAGMAGYRPDGGTSYLYARVCQ
jgi:hypothetical protein